MSITERLASLSIPTVIVTIVVLMVIRLVTRKADNQYVKGIGETAESLAIAMGLVYLIIRPFIVQAFFIPSPSMVPTLIEDDHILVNKFVYRIGEPKRGDVVVFKSPPEARQNEKDFIKRVVAVPGDVVKIKPGYVIVGETPYSHRELALQLSGLSGRPGRTTIKLIDDTVYVSGRPVSSEEVAAAVGQSKAKVKVVPGKVYVNGKPLREPYTAEDPDEPYPGGPDFYVDPAWVVVDSEGDQAVKIPKGKYLVMGDNRNASHDARYWGLLDRSRILGKAMFRFWPIGRMGWVR